MDNGPLLVIQADGHAEHDGHPCRAGHVAKGFAVRPSRVDSHSDRPVDQDGFLPATRLAPQRLRLFPDRHEHADGSVSDKGHDLHHDPHDAQLVWRRVCLRSPSMDEHCRRAIRYRDCGGIALRAIPQ